MSGLLNRTAEAIENRWCLPYMGQKERIYGLANPGKPSWSISFPFSKGYELISCVFNAGTPNSGVIEWMGQQKKCQVFSLGQRKQWKINDASHIRAKRRKKYGLAKPGKASWSISFSFSKGYEAISCLFNAGTVNVGINESTDQPKKCQVFSLEQLKQWKINDTSHIRAKRKKKYGLAKPWKPTWSISFSFLKRCVPKVRFWAKYFNFFSFWGSNWESRILVCLLPKLGQKGKNICFQAALRPKI